jgi:hypothetical protein
VLLFPGVLGPCSGLKGHTGHLTSRRGLVQVRLKTLPQRMALLP